MSLFDLIYRCPACGHDPVTPHARGVRCPSCGVTVDREATRRLHLRVTGAGGATEVPVGALVDRIEALGGPWTRATTMNGDLRYSASVLLRVAGSERPVHFQERLLGFAEHFGAGEPGVLTLTEATLSFEEGDRGTEDPAETDTRAGMDGGSESPAGREGKGAATPPPHRAWDLEEIRSLQASSSSVQLTTERGALLLFRFRNDSTRRWESLLRGAVARRWEALGRGRVVEFQPRIRAVPFGGRTAAAPHSLP